MFRKILFVLVGITLLSSSFTVWADEGTETRPVQRLGTGIPTSIAAAPDGKTLAVGSSIGVWFLDASTLQIINFWDLGLWVERVAYSRDGAMLQVNNSTYETASGRYLGLDTDQANWINHKCSFDGLFCAELELGVIWVVNTATTVRTGLIRQWYPLDVAWSPDSQILYTVDRLSYQIKARTSGDWRISKQTTLEGEKPTYKYVEHIWSKPSKTLTVRYESNRVYVFDAENKIVPRKFIPHHINVTASTVSPDESLIVTSGGDQKYCPRSGSPYQCKVTATSTRIWDARTLTSMGAFPVAFYDVFITADNNVVVGHTLNEIQAWDWHKGVKLWSAPESIGWQCEIHLYHTHSWCQDRTSELAINSSGAYVVSFSNSVSATTAFLRRISDGQLVSKLVGHTSPTGSEELLGKPPYYRWGAIPQHVIYLTGIAFSANGSQVAVSSLDGTTLIWNLP